MLTSSFWLALFSTSIPLAFAWGPSGGNDQFGGHGDGSYNDWNDGTDHWGSPSWKTTTQSASATAAGNPYAPIQTTCPRQPLVRSSAALNPQEARFIWKRNRKASEALSAWLSKHGDFSNDNQPTIGFASSGGGLRAFLEAAGVVQAFDGRDGDAGTNGLYQAFSYQSGISGGSWFVSTLAGNNWPTISDLRTNLWDTGLQSLIPGDPASSEAAPQYNTIVADVIAKQNAGYETSDVDPFAQWVAYGILFPENVKTYLSSVAALSNFTSYNAPFPLYTSVGVEYPEGQCLPTSISPQYEFNPYEFGSWDSGVEAFTPTKYLGSHLNAGQPVDRNDCTIHYDNLAFTWGASSNIFPKFFCDAPPGASSLPIAVALEDIVAKAHPATGSDKFAIYPNPFYGSDASPLVQNSSDLYLVDGGFVGSDIPIWPFIQKPRKVDVIIAADISEDTPDLFPNGSEIRFTYERAQATGLTKMPYIPTADVFVEKGFNKRAAFFGCGDDNGTSTLIYLPNVAYTFPSNQSSLRVAYPPADTDAMIANGVLIGTQNNDPDWPFCLACGIKNRDGPRLPEGCAACLDKYCYRP